MKQGSVRILFYNENADSIVASAGRISTTKGGADAIYEKSCARDKEENIRLIQKILSSGHTSVLEHVFLNLSFDNVSVFVEQFMIEFRLASFTVKSRRYVDFGKMGYVTPDFACCGERAAASEELYGSHMEYLFKEYEFLLEQGIPKEDARFVLPYSFRSNFYCTVNARELVKIVNEMVWGRGRKYPEIAALGSSLIAQCEETLPFLPFESSGFKKEQTEKTKEAENQEWPGSGETEFPSFFSGKGIKTAQPGSVTEDHEAPVVLVDGPAHPEEMICRAAALSAGGRLQADWPDPHVQKEVIRNILSHSRRRELEQVNFTILFNGVSLSGVTHLVRHRMQSILVPDYLASCDFKRYITPESIVKAGLKERYEEVFAKSQRTAERLRKNGFAESSMAYLLLSGLTIPVLTTMNANELLTFIRLRTCSRAQWEIAGRAKELLRILRRRYPALFSLYGPGCYMDGACPEGRMSCGRMKEVRELFSLG
ncbi:FAD-dependent thymidylate synthase [Otoolea muris]|uniref:FAD-dependent thymidylate synthase n=1 Tax=Otoolea muris TaxID=2941515 RepID=UPI00203CDD6B|nr:FAD-dependent thymidylate synthase [Otoolea muris]